MDDGRTLIGWTDSAGTGHVSRVNGSTIEATYDYANTPVRGLVVHADGSFAVLLQDFPPGPGYFDNNKKLSKRTAANAEIWTTQFPKGSFNSVPNPTSFGDTGIGDSRLGYGNGKYQAYFSAHTEPDDGGVEHEGEQLWEVDDNGTITQGTAGSNWGLSHSMAALVDYHPDLNRLTTLGISDCFPTKGLYADRTNLLHTVEANCGGTVWMQLGQMAAYNGGNWLVAFSAQAENTFVGNGIGLISFNGAYQPSAIKWLTTGNNGTEERDPVLARIGAALNSNRFLVGWRMKTAGSFHLAVIDSAGNILDALETVSPDIGWGNRDDSMKTRPDGSVSWLQGTPNSPTLKLIRYVEGGATPPAAVTNLVGPTGVTQDNTPAITWESVTGSTWYKLYIKDSGGLKLNEWYTAAQVNCENGGNCTIDAPALVPGGVNWWGQTYNNVGNGPWSSRSKFTVAPSTPPAAVTAFIAPTGTTPQTNPAFQWASVATSTWYKLYVIDSNGMVHNQWYRHSNLNCSTGTCTASPGLTLPNGLVRWWVQTYNSVGNGPWSARQTFTVMIAP
jgi:hypothetical protein